MLIKIFDLFDPFNNWKFPLLCQSYLLFRFLNSHDILVKRFWGVAFMRLNSWEESFWSIIYFHHGISGVSISWLVVCIEFRNQIFRHIPLFRTPPIISGWYSSPINGYSPSPINGSHSFHLFFSQFFIEQWYASSHYYILTPHQGLPQSILPEVILYSDHALKRFQFLWVFVKGPKHVWRMNRGLTLSNDCGALKGNCRLTIDVVVSGNA